MDAALKRVNKYWSNNKDLISNPSKPDGIDVVLDSPLLKKLFTDAPTLKLVQKEILITINYLSKSLDPNDKYPFDLIQLRRKFDKIHKKKKPEYKTYLSEIICDIYLAEVPYTNIIVFTIMSNIRFKNIVYTPFMFSHSKIYSKYEFNNNYLYAYHFLPLLYSMSVKDDDVISEISTTIREECKSSKDISNVMYDLFAYGLGNFESYESVEYLITETSNINYMQNYFGMYDKLIDASTHKTAVSNPIDMKLFISLMMYKIYYYKPASILSYSLSNGENIFDKTFNSKNSKTIQFGKSESFIEELTLMYKNYKPPKKCYKQYSLLDLKVLRLLSIKQHNQKNQKLYEGILKKLHSGFEINKKDFDRNIMYIDGDGEVKNIINYPNLSNFDNYNISDIFVNTVFQDNDGQIEVLKKLIKQGEKNINKSFNGGAEENYVGIENNMNEEVINDSEKPKSIWNLLKYLLIIFGILLLVVVLIMTLINNSTIFGCRDKVHRVQLTSSESIIERNK